MPCAGLRCKPPLLLAIAAESAPTGTVAPTFAPPVQAARCVEFSRALSRAGQSRRCDLQTRGNADRECDHARISVSGPGSGWAACHDGFGWGFFLHGPASPSRPNTSCPKTRRPEALSRCDPILESSLLVSELTGFPADHVSSTLSDHPQFHPVSRLHDLGISASPDCCL
ncbi:hypothetical protein L1887_42617 [Cichorium endivia]|nr:hypothetical protein L1887_42617 [Cichorium endivia]